MVTLISTTVDQCQMLHC